MPDVILPVLDEAAALPWVLARMPAGSPPIVVDNGSPDGSAEIARALGALVVVEPQRGFGAACCAGLLAATDRGRLLHGLRRLARPARPAARVAAGARRRRRPRARRARAAAAAPGRSTPARPTALWRSSCAGAAGLGLRDLGPMRAARRAPLLELGIADRRFGWPLEMVLRAAAAGWRIAEVPVAYRPRVGRSKVTGTVRGTLRAVRDMAPGAGMNAG